ncbi:MAG: hypothetical protein ACKVX7_01475 [Planctomycetota bacterium]
MQKRTLPSSRCLFSIWNVGKARAIFGARFVASIGLLLGLLLVANSGSAQDEKSTLERLGVKLQLPRTAPIYPGVDVEEGAANAIPKAGRIYWYLPYTLTNESGRDAKFFVSVRASSDKGRKYSDLALPHVARKVERLERRKLQSKVDLVDKDKQLTAYQEFKAGETRECVAIFNPLDNEADTIVVKLYGLVNDILREPLGADKLRVTERVLQVTYSRPGDEFYTSLDKFKLTDQKWITETREVAVPKE